MRSRRALLYMPGDEDRKIRKALTLDVDSICMDLEDGVAVNRKLQARETVLQALKSYNFGRSEKLVRINPVSSGLFVDDLQAVIPGKPDGIVLPKIEYPEHVRRVGMRIGELEQAIHALEAHLESLHTDIATASAAGDTERISRLGEDYTRAENELDSLMGEWTLLAD